jgi:spore maturation protein CgeB
LNKTNRILAIQFAEKFQPLAEDNRFFKTLAELYLKNGKPVLALNLVSKLENNKANQKLLDRIDKALETNVGTSHATLHFIKHNREITLNSSGYSLYLPSEHTHRESGNDIMRLDGTLQLPVNAPVNCALITMKFFSKQGEEIELENDSLLSRSSLVGPYQYLNPDDDGTFSVEFKPPEEFNHALISFQNWKNTNGVRLGPVLEIAAAVEHNSMNKHIDEFEQFCRLATGPVVFVYGSREMDSSVSIDRTSRMISSFSAKKYPVINAYFRNDRSPMKESKLNSGMMSLPIDFVNVNIERLSEMTFDGKQKVLIISNPSPTLVRKIHLFSSRDWVIVSDLNTWRGINFSDFTNGQLHLIASSNNVLVQKDNQRESLIQTTSESTKITVMKDGWFGTRKKNKRSKNHRLVGILNRPDDEIDFSLIAEFASQRSDLNFEILGASWPLRIEKPDNVKSWTVRDATWAIDRMLMWDICVDLPLDSVTSYGIGIPELRYNRIPCIVRANQQSSKTMPYLIRYNNLSQIEIAIEEALIMDRSYVPEIDHISWEETVVNILQQISSLDSETSIELTYDYLPLSELISFAEHRPPKMAEIKNHVQRAFASKGLTIYRDLLWAIDYIMSDSQINKNVVNNLLISSIRGIGAVDPFTAIELAENYQIDDKRISRTMITLYNRTEQYEKSMKLIVPMRNDSWKRKMKEVLERKLKSSSPSTVGKGFFPILLKVACILDKFSHDSLSYEVDLHPVPKENWRSFLEDGKFDFFLAESIWKGHDEQWIWAMSSPDSPNGIRLQSMLEYCSEIGLKKVFWNKEDPVNYEKFISTAKRFDVIFTSDNRSIAQYKQDCGHEEIYQMAFACQPVIHNPVRNKLPTYQTCFAGSWYIREHGDRKRQTKLLVDAAKDYDLHVYDRFYGTNDRNRFPEEYDEFVRGSLPYEECCMAYRSYKVFLNVNSVMNSDTMFSRRVFEILASSTHVLSTPSEGMEKMLPDGVTVVDTLDDAKHSLKQLIDDDEGRNRSAHLGYRHVMNNHTYTHRIGTILEKIGIDSKVEFSDPKISLITCTNRPEMISNILENYDRQLWENKELNLIIDCEKKKFKQIVQELKDRKDIHLQLVKPGLSLGEWFNLGMELCSGQFIGKFDDDDLYGPHYLSDQMLPFEYTNADIVGKLCSFMYHEKSNSTYLRFNNNRHKFSDLVLGPTFLFKRAVAEKVKMRNLSRGEDTNFLKDCIKAGFKIYSTDPYNFVYMRKKVEGFHTWDATDDELLKNAESMGDLSPQEYAFV